MLEDVDDFDDSKGMIPLDEPGGVVAFLRDRMLGSFVISREPLRFGPSTNSRIYKL